MHFLGSRSSEISNVTVKRINAGTVSVCWETPLKDLTVSIHKGRSPVAFDRSSPVAKVRGRTAATISGLDPDARYYFEVVAEGGSGVVTAERLVPLQGSLNFRDLGGYTTSNGSQVKWGHVFRSDNLSNLTDRDQTVLKGMGIKLVCDLRTSPELSRWPDRLPDDGSIDYLQLPIIHGEKEFDFYFEKIMKGELSWLTEEFMINANIRIIDEYGETLGTVLRRLAEPDTLPLVFHCAGGRDRTGVCAALILLALGVPEETVISDYCLTDVSFSQRRGEIDERLRSRGIDPDTLYLYHTAPPRFFVPVIQHIREAYGSSSNYIRTKAGVSDETLALLRRKLLE